MKQDKTAWSCGCAVVGSWALWFAVIQAGQLFARLFRKAYPDVFFGWLPHLRFPMWLSMQPHALLVLVSAGTVALLALQVWSRNVEAKMLIHSAYLTLWACFTAVALLLLLAVPL
jgi:hypothetical protein